MIQPTTQAAMADAHRSAQDRMLETIVAETRQCAFLTGRRQLSPAVLAAIGNIPRHLFVPSEEQEWAYENIPLPIGAGQTISQPFIVALMSDLLQPQADHTVLEIGTGSGYQAAILSLLARQVYSVERIPILAEQARRRLQALHIQNVAVRIADGHQGWPEHAPFDAILVTAAAARLPPALLQQLKPGGRLVIPVGLPGQTQDLQVIEKDARGRIQAHSLLPVAFVPLIESPSFPHSESSPELRGDH